MREHIYHAQYLIIMLFIIYNRQGRHVILKSSMSQVINQENMTQSEAVNQLQFQCKGIFTDLKALVCFFYNRDFFRDEFYLEAKPYLNTFDSNC